MDPALFLPSGTPATPPFRSRRRHKRAILGGHRRRNICLSRQQATLPSRRNRVTATRRKRFHHYNFWFSSHGSQLRCTTTIYLKIHRSRGHTPNHRHELPEPLQPSDRPPQQTVNRHPDVLQRPYRLYHNRDQSSRLLPFTDSIYRSKNFRN
jgi:hypothetical protein